MYIASYSFKGATDLDKYLFISNIVKHNDIHS